MTNYEKNGFCPFSKKLTNDDCNTICFCDDCNTFFDGYNQAIDYCIDKFAEILSSIPQMCGRNCPVNCNWGTNTSCIDMCKKWLREKIKDGGTNGS